MVDPDRDIRWMTYSEAAASLGINPESVAKRMRRQNWPRRTGNDGKPRIGVPVTALPVSDTVPAHVPDTAQTVPGAVPDASWLILALSATARAEKAETLLAEHREAAARAQGEAEGLREALRIAEAAAETARQAEAQARQAAEAAQNADETAKAALAAWTEGGPLTRALRGFFRKT